MATQKGGYHTKDGQRVPSVTTILSACSLGGCDGLISWAVDLTKQGKDWKDVRDRAADAGTLCHEAAEAWAKGNAYTFEGDSQVVAKAQQAFGAFMEWTRQTQLRIIETELPLVSEKHRFGGTFDCMLMGNKRVMGDFKTSNSIQTKMLIQIAAYAKLWEEHHPDQSVDGGFILLRFGREYGDFSHRWWGELDSAWEAFLAMRQLYEINKELRKRIA